MSLTPIDTPPIADGVVPGVDGNFQVPQAPAPLPFTGERMTGAVSGQIEYEHLHRYCLARDYCAGRDVLDVASGEGYGTALLAAVARSAVGVELDAASVAHARASYEQPGLHFEQGDALALPLPPASVDVVVSFETIEHLPDVGRFLDEIQRVLRPGGLLVISTPDRTFYSGPGSDPNPYHVLEMTGAEFRHTLGARFANLSVAAQRPVLGSVMAASGGGWRSYERRSHQRAEASPGLSRPPYLVALASDAPLPALPSSVYLDASRVHDVVEAAGQALELRADVARLEAALRDAQAHAAGLQAECTALADGRAAQEAAADGLRAELAASAAALASLQAECQSSHASLRAARHELAGAEQRAAAASRDAAQRREHETHLLGLLAERAAEWERVNQVLAQQAAELDRVAAAHQAAERERDALHASVSWRVSRPVRTAGVGLRRAARLARLPQRALAARALRAHRLAETEALRGTPLFHAEWYRDQVPGLREAGHDSAAHYAWTGAAAGLMPNPYFDTAWYRARYPAVAQASENPLLHWIREGAAQHLDPNPFFRSAWYVAQHPEAASDPLLHWIEHGVPERLDPNPMLDAEAYALEYNSVRDSGLDALLHWWHHGSGEGLNPHPLFDSAFYRAHHGLPAGADPLAHWLAEGEAAGLVTSPILLRAGAPARPLAFTPEPDPLVSVIIPVYGHYADTWRCLYALMAGTDAGADPAIRYEVIVADDCPENRVVPLLQRRIPGVRWRQNAENMGFLRSCNAAEKITTAPFVVFLNNDAEVHPGWLPPLLRLVQGDAGIGMVGCKLLNGDGTLQEAGGAILSNGWGEPYGSGGDPTASEYNFVRDVDVVVGACFLVRRAAFDALGGFDLRYAPAFYEEFDLAFALRQAGLRTVYQPASAVTHRGSNSYGAAMRDRQSMINHAKFCAKWQALLPGQPAPGSPALLWRQRPPRAGFALVIDDRVLEWNRQAGALTTHLYIGLLQSMGYAVTYAAAADPAPLQPYLGDMQQNGIEVLLGEDALHRWLHVHGRSLDLVWVARPDVAGPLLPVLHDAIDAPVLYYTHDLHHLRERRRWTVDGDPAALEESKRLMRIEHDIFATADQVMTPSSVEADIIRADVPGASVHVIPPYLVEMQPDPQATAGARDAVTFVGGFAHPPNLDAALWLVQAIMPQVWAAAPEIRVVIVGHAPPPALQDLASERVEVTGFVEDLAAPYARTFCTVSPLRYGAGVKGKIISGIQASLPVVTTAVGNEGLDLVDGAEALVADSEEAIAAAIVALWRSPELGARLASSAARRMRDRYSRAAATEALQVVLDAARRKHMDKPRESSQDLRQ